MTDESQQYGAYYSGPSANYNNGVFTWTSGGSGSVGYIVDSNPNATQINVGDTIEYYPSAQTTVPETGTYLGYYLYNGVQNPLIQSGSTDTLLLNGAAFINAPNNIPINSSAYTQGTVTCFVTGTSIRILRDGADVSVAVETLEVGDLAFTASGARRPIRWIGNRDLDGRGSILPHGQWPVRISQGAFGSDGHGVTLPARDLLLSPGHPVLVGADEDGNGGHLVPIMCLINGTTIERVPVESVTYWHVELDEHDILLAEDLPAESYIDLGSRQWFDGAEGVLYDPDMALPGTSFRCRPVAVDGPVVEAERRRLDMIFELRLATACAWPIAEDALSA